MGFITLYYGRFFDEEGKHLDDKFFRKSNDTFEYSGKAYNIKRDCPTYTEKKGLLINKRYYYYNISNSDPIKINKKVEPIIDPQMYNIQLKNNIAKKLNEVNTTGLLDKIGIKEILIGLGAIALIILLLTGNLIPS